MTEAERGGPAPNTVSHNLTVNIIVQRNKHFDLLDQQNDARGWECSSKSFAKV